LATAPFWLSAETIHYADFSVMIDSADSQSLV